MKTALRITLLFFLIMACSCSTARVYTNEAADFGYYEQVGVLPLSNLTNDRSASEKMTAAFVTELLIGGGVEVAPMGDVYKALKTIIKDDRTNLPDQITANEAQAICTEAKVQGIFVGAVREYGMVRSGQEEFPLVSVSIRFLDSQSGQVVWTCELTRKGGPKFPVFSFGETHTLGEMTAKTCREVATSFLRKIK